MGKLIPIEPRQVNNELLAEELSAAGMPVESQEGTRSIDGRHILIGIQVSDDATDEDVAHVQQLVAVHDHTQLSLKQQQRVAIIQNAHSAAGAHIDSLTPTQVRALLVLLLKAQNAVADDNTIRPIADWSPVQAPPQMVLG